jgi:hypothetical protein
MELLVGEVKVAGGDPVPARIATEGRLEGITVPELLWRLALERHTGSLVLERPGVTKTLALRDGRVVFATSSDPEDQLGPFLLRRGEVRLGDLLEADARLDGGRRLGETLVELGHLAPPALPRAVQEQVREIALSVFGWRDGAWRLTRAALPVLEPVTLDLAVEDLVLAGTRRVRDWNWVRRVVGGSRAVYRATPASRGDVLGLGLTERLILEQLQLPLRVEQLCSAVYAPTHDIYRALWALAITGRVERVERSSLGDYAASEHEGPISRAGIGDLLLDLAARHFDGTLRLFRDAEEGALFLREGRIEFASTSDQEQSLAAHLVRRGVISDRDQDEAVRQLITGKRMGTLLAERGVLLPEDVERFVREQVMAVARGLVLWDAGEYEIEPGVTVDESIVLGIAAEDLVVSAWESLTAWQRIFGHLGSTGTRFRLRPDYLDRLDRMTLRPAMWDVVALLAEPHSVAEILAARPDSDFELCRLLCALDAARVIERTEERAGQAAEAAAAATPAEPAAVAGPVELAPVEFAFPVVELPETAQAAPAPTVPPVPPRTAAELAPELFAETPAEAPAAPAWLETAFELATPGEEAILPPALDGFPDPAALATSVPLELGEPSAVPDDGYEQAFFAPLAEPVPAETASPEPVPAVAEPAEPAPAEPAPVVADATPVPEPGPGPAPEPEWEAMPWTEADLTGPLGGPPAPALAPPALPPPPLAAPPSASPPEALPWEPLSAEELAQAEHSPTGPLTSAVFGAEAHLEALARAARAAAEDGPLPMPPSDPPSPELLDAVEAFNRRHALVYQQLRLEIGAAVRNLVVACVRRMGPAGEPFEGIVLDRNGVFDREALARALRVRWGGAPAEPLEGLVREELAMVRDLVSPQRLASVEAQLNLL